MSSGAVAVLHHDLADNPEHPPLFKVLAVLPVLGRQSRGPPREVDDQQRAPLQRSIRRGADEGRHHASGDVCLSTRPVAGVRRTRARALCIGLPPLRPVVGRRRGVALVARSIGARLGASRRGRSPVRADHCARRMGTCPLVACSRSTFAPVARSGMRRGGIGTGHRIAGCGSGTWRRGGSASASRHEVVGPLAPGCACRVDDLVDCLGRLRRPRSKRRGAFLVPSPTPLCGGGEVPGFERHGQFAGVPSRPQVDRGEPLVLAGVVGRQAPDTDYSCC